MYWHEPDAHRAEHRPSPSGKPHTLASPPVLREVPLPALRRNVIGNSYYATLDDSRLRLRLDFYDTIVDGLYGGLRARLLHPEKGLIDVAVLSFADHGTFAQRDSRAGRRPGGDGYGVMRDWHHDGRPPWEGGDFTSLRRAVVDYAAVWAPAVAEDGRNRDASATLRPASVAPAPIRAVSGGRRAR